MKIITGKKRITVKKGSKMSTIDKRIKHIEKRIEDYLTKADLFFIIIEIVSIL